MKEYLLENFMNMQPFYIRERILGIHTLLAVFFNYPIYMVSELILVLIVILFQRSTAIILEPQRDVLLKIRVNSVNKKLM